MIATSLLLPARRDSTYLRGFIENFDYVTSDKSNVELVVSLSKNDVINKELLKNRKDVKVVFDDKSLGRWGLHEYMNSLVKASTGELLWHLCDDMRIENVGYDIILAHYAKKFKDKIYVLFPTGNIGGAVCPLITRKWADTTGHWGNGYSVDSWIGEVTGPLPIERQFHLREIQVDDVTRTEEKGKPKARPDLDADHDKIHEYLKTREWSKPVIREETRRDADLLLKAMEEGC